MGLFAFNRMRLRRVEEMRPENIELTNKKEQEKIKVEEPIEVNENGEVAPEEKKTTRRRRK